VLNLLTARPPENTEVFSENTEVLHFMTAVFFSDDSGVLGEHRGVELHDCGVLRG